jgi:glycosyltransferase involved in cell wall biosynthesis
MLGHAAVGNQASPFLKNMITVSSFYFGTYSWANHARGFVDALNRIEEVGLVPWDVPVDAAKVTTTQWRMIERGRSDSGNGVALAIGPIERMPLVRGAWRIGFVVWETTGMPADKVRCLQQMDEIWTPSHWGREILMQNGLDGARVRVVPEGVDAAAFPPAPERRSGPPFRFLAVGKWEVRKGIDLLVSAFCAEFRHEEPVELVLHCHNPYLPGFHLDRRIQAAARGPHAPIRSSHDRPGESIADLYHSCDAFVLPTRAEGWGLPIMEAMSCELPVIVTDYSAPHDYLDESIAYLIPVERMIPVDDPMFFRPGDPYGLWAQPDGARLRQILRHVFNHPDEAREKGRRARNRVVNRWTWRHAAETAHSLLPKPAAQMGASW